MSARTHSVPPAVEPQWVEVASVDEGWVDFDDPQGRAVMTWQTARHLHTVARDSDSGSVLHKGRRFDRDVLAAVVRAIDDAPVCTATPDGRSMCERPALPGTNPPRCSADDRSNR